MKIVLPAQNVQIDKPSGVDPIWFEKFQHIVAVLNNGTVGQGLLPAISTAGGHGFMSTCVGPPTGVPVARPGYVPFVYDVTNNKLWIYNGAWRGVVVT